VRSRGDRRQRNRLVRCAGAADRQFVTDRPEAHGSKSCVRVTKRRRVSGTRHQRNRSFRVAFGGPQPHRARFCHHGSIRCSSKPAEVSSAKSGPPVTLRRGRVARGYGQSSLARGRTKIGELRCTPLNSEDPLYSARNNSAVGVRDAMRPGMAATILASTRPPTTMRTTDRTGTVVWGTALISCAKRSHK